MGIKRMNERIKELVYLAERYARDTISATKEEKFNTFFQEKFAELVVRECLSRIEGCTIIKPMNIDPPTEFEQGYDKAIQKVYSQVKLHFGM